MGQMARICAAAQEARPSCSAAALQRRTMPTATGLNSAAIPPLVCLPGCGPALTLHACCCLMLFAGSSGDSKTAFKAWRPSACQILKPHVRDALEFMAHGRSAMHPVSLSLSSVFRQHLLSVHGALCRCCNVCPYTGNRAGAW